MRAHLMLALFIASNVSGSNREIRSKLSCEEDYKVLPKLFYRARRKIPFLPNLFNENCSMEYKSIPKGMNIASCSYKNLEIVKADVIMYTNESSSWPMDICLLQMKKELSELQLTKNSNCSKAQMIPIVNYYTARGITKKMKDQRNTPCLFAAMSPNSRLNDDRCNAVLLDYLSYVAEIMISPESNYKDLLLLKDPPLPSCDLNVLRKMQIKSLESRELPCIDQLEKLKLNLSSIIPSVCDGLDSYPSYGQSKELSCRDKLEKLKLHLSSINPNPCGRLDSFPSIIIGLNEANCSYLELETLKKHILSYISSHYSSLEGGICETIVLQKIARKQTKYSSNCTREEAEEACTSFVRYLSINSDITMVNCPCLRTAMTTNKRISDECDQHIGNYLDYVAKSTMSPKYTRENLKYTFKEQIPACDAAVLQKYRDLKGGPCTPEAKKNLQDNFLAYVRNYYSLRGISVPESQNSTSHCLFVDQSYTLIESRSYGKTCKEQISLFISYANEKKSEILSYRTNEPALYDCFIFIEKRARTLNKLLS